MTQIYKSSSLNIRKFTKAPSWVLALLVTTCAYGQDGDLKPESDKNDKGLDISHMTSADANDHFENVTQRHFPVVNTLTDALIQAYQNNNELQSKRRSVLASHAKVTQAKAGFLPKIDAQSYLSGQSQNTLRNTYQSPDVPNYTTEGSVREQLGIYTSDANLSISQNLFAGGATAADVKSADQTVRSNWADLLNSEQGIFNDVITAYLDLVSKIAAVNVRKANKNAMQQNYDMAAGKHKLGEETITQVKNAESRLMQAEAELRAAESAVEVSKANFSAKTGATPGTLTSPSLPKGLPESLDRAIQISFENHPAILSAKYAYEASKSDLVKANAQMLSPTVDLEATLNRNIQRSIPDGASVTGNAVQNYTPKSENSATNQSVRIAMRYNIYNGGTYSSQRRAAHDNALSKRFTIENLKDQVKAGMTGTLSQWNAAKLNIEQYKKQVEALKISVEATRQEMEVGTKVLKDVLDAQVQLVQAQVSLIEAENQYYTAAYKMVSWLGGLHAKALKLNVPYFDPKYFYDNMPIGF